MHPIRRNWPARVGCILAALLGGHAAQAQDELEQVIVTGSRIARPDFDSASNTLPQLVPSYTSTSNNPANGGQANVNVRGLGDTSTLVLVDGRRLMGFRRGRIRRHPGPDRPRRRSVVRSRRHRRQGFRGGAWVRGRHEDRAASLRSSYDITVGALGGLRLGIGIENVADEDPPIFPSFVQANTDPSQYDVFGRRYYASLKYAF